MGEQNWIWTWLLKERCILARAGPRYGIRMRETVHTGAGLGAEPWGHIGFWVRRAQKEQITRGLLRMRIPYQSHASITLNSIWAEMCSERDSPLEPFVLPAPVQPELARLTCGAHLCWPANRSVHGSIHSCVIGRPRFARRGHLKCCLGCLTRSHRPPSVNESSQPAAHTSWPEPARQASFAWVRR